MWRKMQPELLKKIISVPERVTHCGGDDTNTIDLKSSRDVKNDQDHHHRPHRPSAGVTQNEFAVAVTVVRYFDTRQVKQNVRENHPSTLLTLHSLKTRIRTKSGE